MNLRLHLFRLRPTFLNLSAILIASNGTRGNCLQIYVDAVMGLNFLVDFLLLLGTNRLAGYPSNKRRLLAASVLGAAYSGVCLLPSFRFLGNLLWRTVSLAIMGSIAFGWNGGAVRRCVVFLLLSLALGGLAVSFGRADIQGLVVGSFILWILCRMAFESPVGSREYVPLEIRYGEQSVKLLALRDTGNTLRDPVTGEQALVISPAAACRLTGLSQQQIQSPLETMSRQGLPGLRLIPYCSVGQGRGMMLAMRFQDVKIGQKQQSALVAFAPDGFGEGSAYQALTGGTI